MAVPLHLRIEICYRVCVGSLVRVHNTLLCFHIPKANCANPQQLKTLKLERKLSDKHPVKHKWRVKKSCFLTSASEVVIVSAAFAHVVIATPTQMMASLKGKDQLSQTWLAVITMVTSLLQLLRYTIGGKSLVKWPAIISFRRSITDPVNC